MVALLVGGPWGHQAIATASKIQVMLLVGAVLLLASRIARMSAGSRTL
ncbi:MAG TPA: hypothetical protein VNU27_08215 [Candidatus Acidoferrum sp.]|jgi:hypothetical protein|nr:hypothetical protein [Candidatus Angelobacter sp.]HXD81545.1 hypothetical protein [Candidatus Acidoferrum sp.]